MKRRTLSSDVLGSMSRSDLEKLRIELVDRVETLQAQLSNRNKTDPEGSRVNGIAYHEWRTRTVGALGHAHSDVRLVKDALGRERGQGQGQRSRRNDLTMQLFIYECDGLAILDMSPETVCKIRGQCEKAADVILAAWDSPLE